MLRKENLVSESKWGIKCPYPMNPTYITVHNTANDASADNEIAYMIGNDNEVSFHFAVDDTGFVQGIREDRNAWHASDGGEGIGNRKSIAIEICYSKSGGDKFDKAEINAAILIAELMNKYGIDINHVKRHYDFATDHKYCPHRTMDKGWDRFLNMVREQLGQDTVTPAPIPEKDEPTQPNTNTYAEAIDQVLHIGSHVRCDHTAITVTNYDKPTGDVFLAEIDTWVHPKDVDKNYVTNGSDFILYLGDKVHFNVTQMTVSDYDAPTGDVFIKEIDTWVHPKDFTEVQ